MSYKRLLLSRSDNAYIDIYTSYILLHFLLCLSVQHGESALQIAVHRGHLDVVKVLVQVYQDLHTICCCLTVCQGVDTLPL